LAPGGPSPSGGGAIDFDFSDALNLLLAKTVAFGSAVKIMEQNNNSFKFLQKKSPLIIFIFGMSRVLIIQCDKIPIDIFNKFLWTSGHFAAQNSCL
jgi:hypothetical protein